MKKTKLVVSMLVVAAVAGGGLLYNTYAQASGIEPDKKPVGYEGQQYKINPEPVLKSNTDNQDQLVMKKDKIMKNFKLKNNDKMLSSELKTWKQYNTTEGDNGKNTEVADDRLVYVVKVDKPDGISTRGGFYKNAIVTYVIDADTEKQVEMFVKGTLDPQSVPFNNPIVGEDKK